VDKKRFLRLPPFPLFSRSQVIKPSYQAAFDHELRNKRICEGEYEFEWEGGSGRMKDEG